MDLWLSEFFKFTCRACGYRHPVAHVGEVVVALPFSEPKVWAKLFPFGVEWTEKFKCEPQWNHWKVAHCTRFAGKVNGVVGHKGQHALLIIGQTLMYRYPLHGANLSEIGIWWRIWCSGAGPKRIADSFMLRKYADRE